jgi:hypothetical protein
MIESSRRNGDLLAEKSFTIGHLRHEPSITDRRARPRQGARSGSTRACALTGPPRRRPGHPVTILRAKRHEATDAARRGCSHGLGASPSARCKGLPPSFLRLRKARSGSVQPVPRKAPFRLHTLVSPTGRKQPPLLRKPLRRRDHEGDQIRRLHPHHQPHRCRP